MPETTKDVALAAGALRSGRLVAFPTETVYGLGANARDEAAVRGVFEIKRRPADHPLIVHLPHPSDMGRWAREVPEEAEALAGAFMPGPLTLVLKRAEGVGEAASGGRPTVALRVPAGETALALLEAAGTELVAPSANGFGRPSPTRASHVAADFAGSDLLILDGGPTAIGIESTVVDLSDPGNPAILRPGALARDEIERALGRPVAVGGTGVAAPGTLASHYSPRQRLVVLDEEGFDGCVADHPEETVGALGFSRPGGLSAERWRRMDGDPTAAAKKLYDDLRFLESTDATLIAACRVPDGGGWEAVADRLRRAAS